MPTLKTLPATAGIEEIARIAAREPVRIEREGEPALVMINAEAFDRMAERAEQQSPDEIDMQGMTPEMRALLAADEDPLIRAARAMHRTAAARGLTPAELDRLLAHDD